MSVRKRQKKVKHDCTKVKEENVKQKEEIYIYIEKDEDKNKKYFLVFLGRL